MLEIRAFDRTTTIWRTCIPLWRSCLPEVYSYKYKAIPAQKDVIKNLAANKKPAAAVCKKVYKTVGGNRQAEPGRRISLVGRANPAMTHMNCSTILVWQFGWLTSQCWRPFQARNRFHIGLCAGRFSWFVARRNLALGMTAQQCEEVGTVPLTMDLARVGFWSSISNSNKRNKNVYKAASREYVSCFTAHWHTVYI